MTGKIPHYFINELLIKTNIVDLISAKIQIKKKGKYFYAICPFHNEKTPSFVINYEKQFYYCFGCKTSGNSIDFLINYNKFLFVEAIEELASQHNLEIPYEKKFYRNKKIFYKKNFLYKIMSDINNFYKKFLHDNKILEANNYLKQRGLNKLIIKNFSIGFAPKGNNIIKYFGSSNKYIDLLNKSGILFINNNGKIYDIFQKRIIFPILDIKGRTIAFGGRSLGNEKPKYLNSSETDIFHKSKQVYGLYEVIKEHKMISKLILVEGYIDVLSLFQFGINYAVSSLGTSTTLDHIKILYNFTNNLICCYDGDLAGRKASRKTLEIVLPYLTKGRQIYFVILPEGEDPDSLIRKIGKKKFEQVINQAKTISIFLFESLAYEIDISNCYGRAKLCSIALSLIEQIPDRILKLFLRQELGNKIGIIDDYQLKQLYKIKKTKNNFSTQLKVKNKIMYVLIGLLIQKPKLSKLVLINKEIKNSTQPSIKIFIELVEKCLKNSKLTTYKLLKYYKKDKLYSKLETLAKWNHMIIDEAIKDTFLDTLNSLYRYILKSKQNILIAKERIYGLNIDERKEFWSINKRLSKKIK